MLLIFCIFFIKFLGLCFYIDTFVANHMEKHWSKLQSREPFVIPYNFIVKQKFLMV